MRVKRQRLFIAGIAMAAATSFLLAENYCACEALSDDHPHSASTHHHEAAGHHHHEDGHSSDGQADPCCSTLQAIVAPQVNLHFTLPSQDLFPCPSAEAVEAITFAGLIRVSTGLSPPAREPTPHRPFYRTAFASHAPPICLA